MALSTRIVPRGLTFTALLDELTSPAAKSARLAEIAQEKIDEASGINRAALGREVDYETFVDGQKGRALEEVRPDGRIVAQFDLLGETLVFVLQMLQDNSPVLSGRYRISHTFLADGQEADINNPPRGAGEYAFVSSVPYARKIERGLSDQAPDGVYQVTATMAQRRFGNIARVRFGYRAPLFGMIEEWASGTGMESPGRRGAQRAEWLRRQPAIIITAR